VKKAGNEVEENQVEWNWRLLHTYSFITIKFVFFPGLEESEKQKYFLVFLPFLNQTRLTEAAAHRDRTRASTLFFLI
jgi:hypothetical protein